MYGMSWKHTVDVALCSGGLQASHGSNAGIVAVENFLGLFWKGRPFCFSIFVQGFQLFNAFNASKLILLDLTSVYSRF